VPREENALIFAMEQMRRALRTVRSPRPPNTQSGIRGVGCHNVYKCGNSSDLSRGNRQGKGIAFKCEGSGNTRR
jgi:hypothetical protein